MSDAPDVDAVDDVEPDFASRQTIIAGDADVGERLDRVLALHLPEFSRARLQGLIRAGDVRNGEGKPHLTASAKVKAGEVIVIDVPPPEDAEPKPEHMALTIVHEDASLIVIDKPAGLVVHPAAGHNSGTLVNGLLAHCGDTLSGIGGVRRPGIVHRLDKDTSGLLVVAKTDKAHQGLSAQFAAHGADGLLQRQYLALVWGTFDRPKGVIDAPLGRSPTHRIKMAVVPLEDGRHAVTHYERLATVACEGKTTVSLVRLTLETGRTHQIRVHLAHIGHPVLGDQTYGMGFSTSINKLPPKAADGLRALGRQALHAAVLGFKHPITGRKMRFESALPADMALITKALRLPGMNTGG
jgi:23S rRNA pseudouridine1911/1915/1917 synthase